LIKTISHQHSKVRIAAVNAIGKQRTHEFSISLTFALIKEQEEPKFLPPDTFFCILVPNSNLGVFEAQENNLVAMIWVLLVRLIRFANLIKEERAASALTYESTFAVETE